MKTQRTIWRRRLLRAALCLLLGAVTTVGVAWGAVLVLDDLRYDTASLTHAGEHYMFFENWSPAVTIRQASRWAAGDPMGSVDGQGQGPALAQLIEPTRRQLSRGVPIAETALGRRMLAGGWGWMNDEGQSDSVSLAAGWPFRTVWGHAEIGDDEAVLVGLHAMNVPLGPSGATAVWLPLRPLWPGLILNTLLYATMFWLLFATPGAIRRWRRRRRGACVACGYDLRGIGDGAKCPECGRAARC